MNLIGIQQPERSERKQKGRGEKREGDSSSEVLYELFHYITRKVYLKVKSGIQYVWRISAKRTGFPLTTIARRRGRQTPPWANL